jgi:uncharacterized membrane protein YgaE (UPF0421/DUF939 family)
MMMGTETLFLVLLVSLTVLAYMIAINAHGVWRMTLSFLLATCMLGGTVWVIILQYSTTTKTAVQIERRRLETERRELLQDREQTLAMKEQAGNAARVSHLIAQANGFAATLQTQALQEQGYTHEQLIARAAACEQRLAALQNEIDTYRQAAAGYPDAAKLLADAMAELTEACKLYKSYYYAENSAAEQARERQMKQKARKAQELLAKADKTLGVAGD